jgi:hypothetical protein
VHVAIVVELCVRRSGAAKGGDRLGAKGGGFGTELGLSASLHARADWNGDSNVSPNTYLPDIADFDAEEDKYMAVSVVEWVPTDFKVGLNEVPAVRVRDIGGDGRNVVMIGILSELDESCLETVSAHFAEGHTHIDRKMRRVPI